MVTAGVNRVSLGVQSFRRSEAHSSGRLHSRAIVEDDFRRLRAAGITNLNVDLIAGLAGQTFASWEESLEALIDSGVPHASVYMLEVDEDSRLGREMLRVARATEQDLVPHDDAIARMYERAIERLEVLGSVSMRFRISPARIRVEAQYALLAAAAVSGRGAGCVVSWHCMQQPLGMVAKQDIPWASPTTTDDLKEYLEGPATPTR